MKKAIVVILIAYTVYASYTGLAAADQVKTISNKTEAAIKAATDY